MPTSNPLIMVLPVATFMALACTYRTDLRPSSDRDTGLAPEAAGVGGTGGALPAGATGGTTTGTDARPPADDGACSRDDECIRCVYLSAPANSSECEQALGCCGGPVMNQTACELHKTAWNAYCAGRGYSAPNCPCIACTGDTPVCKNGQCGLSGC